MKKYFVNGGPFQGETAIITSEQNNETAMVKLIDDHGRDISEEAFPMPKSYLEEM
ncbi:hypothetical protein J5751_05525 [bacterium]|nr:hypothetical protein [bacterium]